MDGGLTKRTIGHDIFNMPIRKKTKAESRQKGATNEWECAKTVTLWVGEKFTRVPASGGLGWKRNRGIASDLIPENPDYIFPFIVETKHLHRLDKPVVSKIWVKVLEDAVKGERMPLALLRRDGQINFKVGQRPDHVIYKDYYLILDMEWGGMLVALKVKPQYEFVGPNDENLVAFLFSDVYHKLPWKQLNKSIQSGNYLERFRSQYTFLHSNTFRKED